MGGSSNINGMMYIRGNPKDFDRWAKLAEDPAWEYKNVLPYFQKSEDYHGNYELGTGFQSCSYTSSRDYVANSVI